MNKDNFQALVQAAVHESSKREALREVICGFVVDEIPQFLAKHRLPDQIANTLYDAGVAPFDRAFNAYVRNWLENYPANDFRDYYRWWMRQAWVARLINEGYWDGDGPHGS